jgi:glutamate-1-semialdehyde aminotransferase
MSYPTNLSQAEIAAVIAEAVKRGMAVIETVQNAIKSQEKKP